MPCPKQAAIPKQITLQPAFSQSKIHASKILLKYHLLAGVGVACFAGVWVAGTGGKTGETLLGAGLSPCPGKG